MRKISKMINKQLSEMTPEEVPIGTSITLKKTKDGWTATRFCPYDPKTHISSSRSHMSSEESNLIPALKKVIGIY